MTKNIGKFSGWILLLTCVAALVGAIHEWYWSLPTAYISSSTQQCVRVEILPGQKSYTCDDLADIQYTTIWVP